MRPPACRACASAISSRGRSKAPRPGRFGLQRFFSQGGRAFSLYVIAREGEGLAEALRQLETQLGEIGVAAR